MTHLDLIEKQYPGRATITLEEVASIIPFAYKTLRNKHGQGTLEFPTFKIGKLILVSVVQLADWLDRSSGLALSAPATAAESVRRGPGRPRKGGVQ